MLLLREKAGSRSFSEETQGNAPSSRRRRGVIFPRGNSRGGPVRRGGAGGCFCSEEAREMLCLRGDARGRFFLGETPGEHCTPRTGIGNAPSPKKLARNAFSPRGRGGMLCLRGDAEKCLCPVVTDGNAFTPRGRRGMLPLRGGKLGLSLLEGNAWRALFLGERT